MESIYHAVTAFRLMTRLLTVDFHCLKHFTVLAIS